MSSSIEVCARRSFAGEPSVARPNTSMLSEVERNSGRMYIEHKIVRSGI